MYVVYAMLHPYHDNSLGWVVDVLPSESSAINLVEKLQANLPVRGGVTHHFDPALTEAELATLVQVHPRAVPNTLDWSDRFYFLSDEYSISYFVSDLARTCVPLQY